VIYSIQDGGLLDLWNRQHDNLVVHPGFVITEAHGERDFLGITEEMEQRCYRSDVVNMTVSSVPPRGAGTQLVPAGRQGEQ